MTSENPASEAHLTKTARLKILLSLGVSLFWVVFLWGFWKKDVHAIGINATVYLALLASLFLMEMRRAGVGLKENRFWLIPIGLIIASFGLYDNPFMKPFSMLALPVLFAVFCNFSFLADKGRAFWNAHFALKLVERGFSLLGHLWQSASSHGRLLTGTGSKGMGTTKRVVLGVGLFVVIALTIIVPLLSSADTVFAAKTDAVVDWFQSLVSTTAVYKIFFALLFSLLTLAALLSWARPWTFEEKTGEKKHVDPIISGIVLGGILGLYLLFLGIQLGHLWVGSLPVDFRATEQLVKSGFWQLLFLSAINICFYFFTYQKTVAAVQKILFAFTVASLLLLASAAHRMGLYVTVHGFSYEKFYASYTVLFCAILFVWLITRLFIARRSDILKFLVILFMWMFSLAAIFPVEQFVLRANHALAQRPGSRVNLYELSMLSPDVLGLIQRYQKEGKLKERPDVLPFDWNQWIESRKAIVAKKAWYEKNLTNWIYWMGD